MSDVDGETDFDRDSPNESRKRLKKKSQIKEEEDDISLPSSSDDDEKKNESDEGEGDKKDGEASDAEVVEAEVKEEAEDGEEVAEAEEAEEASEKEDDGKKENEKKDTNKGKKRTRDEKDKERPKKKRKTNPRNTKAKKKRKQVDYKEDSESEEHEPDHQDILDFTHRSGLPPLEMSAMEIQYFPTYADGFQMRYLDMRNYLVYTWKSDPKQFLPLDKARSSVKDEFAEELEPIYDFLTRFGYINVGVFQGWEGMKVTFPEGRAPRVVIIGAGAAGLGAGQQLLHWGYNVTILEARERIGGRCNTTNEVDADVDLGASIITGLIRNPLDNLYTQLDIRGHEIGTDSLMRTPAGEPIDAHLDKQMDKLFNSLLENVAKTKDPTIGDRSLGREMERVIPKLSPLEMNVLNWYYANLEYACATDLSELSVLHWDQDDFFDFAGAHMILVDGYSSMVKPLAQNLNVKTNHAVKKITYGSAVADVVVECTNGEMFTCDTVLLTVPLGVLKTDMIQFQPTLPSWKKEAIHSLGFGLLNKVVVLFDEVFWDKNKDWFGKVTTDNSRENRGLYYLWWNYYRVSGQPILVGIVAGRASHNLEERTDENIMKEVEGLMKTMFGLTYIPKVLKYKITRWKHDIYARGSYSYVALGSSGEDYDKLSRTIDFGGRSRIFFGGEHTCRQYPATVAGAYASGLREAEKIHRYFYPPPPASTRPVFRPTVSEKEKAATREKSRKELVNATKGQKSRTRAPYRRGVRSSSNSGKDINPFKRKLKEIMQDEDDEDREEEKKYQSSFEYRPIFSSSEGSSTTSQTTTTTSTTSSTTTSSTTTTTTTAQTAAPQYRTFAAFSTSSSNRKERNPEDYLRRTPKPASLSNSGNTLSGSGGGGLSNSAKSNEIQSRIPPQQQSSYGYNQLPQQLHQQQQQKMIPIKSENSNGNSIDDEKKILALMNTSLISSIGGGPGVPPPLNLVSPSFSFTNNAAANNNPSRPEVNHHNSLFQNIKKEDPVKKEEDRKKRDRDRDKRKRRSSSKRSKEPRDLKAKVFMKEAAQIIVNRLSRHLKDGKVKQDDFKDICRKLTHKVADHERKNGGDFKLNDKKKTKMKKLVDGYVKAKSASKSSSKSSNRSSKSSNSSKRSSSSSKDKRRRSSTSSSASKKKSTSSSSSTSTTTTTTTTSAAESAPGSPVPPAFAPTTTVDDEELADFMI